MYVFYRGQSCHLLIPLTIFYLSKSILSCVSMFFLKFYFGERNTTMNPSLFLCCCDKIFWLKAAWRRKDLCGTSFHSPWWGKSGWENGGRNWCRSYGTVGAQGLALQCLLSLLFFFYVYNLGPSVLGGTTHNDLVPLTPIFHWENASQSFLQSNLMQSFSDLRFLDDSVLCRVDTWLNQHTHLHVLL